MPDLPATAALERTSSPPKAKAPDRDALSASALERLWPVLAALLCLWSLVFWALR